MNADDPWTGEQSPRAKAWIFPWRRSFRRRWSLLFAALVVLPIVGVLMSTVRVRVFFTPPALNRSAELVMVPDTQGNRAWLEKIAQQTPFPEVGPVVTVEGWSDAQWRGEMRAVFEPGQKLRDVPLTMTKPVFEQNWWWPPLEQPAGAVSISPVPQGKRLQPRVRWLSVLAKEQVPADFPDYAGPVGILSGSKFMLEVDAEGRVTTCLSSAKDAESQLVVMENWLRRLRFPESKQGLGWLACEIIWEYEDD